MKKYFFAILLALPLLSIAQSNYKKGFIVTAGGDTLRGYINYKEWGRNPNHINFKRGLNDKAGLLGINDIRYFEIDGEVSYQRYTVKISLNPIDLSSPPSLHDTASLTSAVFLKVMQKGKNITLYAYRDGLKNRFYVMDHGIDVPYELIYGIYDDPDNFSSVITKNTFRNQLSQLAGKYQPGLDKLASQIMELAYNENDLMAVTATINGVSEAEAGSKSSGNPSVRFFVGGAFSSGTLKYSADETYYGAAPSTSSSPKITIGADAMPNPDAGHLIFRMELGYTVNNFSINGHPDPLYNIAEPTVMSLKLKQNVLFLTPQVIYNIYNADLFKVFLDLGYSVNLVSYQATDIYTVYQNGQPVSSTSKPESNPSATFKDIYSSFQFKAGVVISKRFEIYVAFSPGAEISNSLNYTTSLSSYQLGLNYFLGKVAH